MSSKGRWLVYVLECSNGSYYTGITTDIRRRLLEHGRGRGGYYTRAFGPVKLRHLEAGSSRSAALRREAQIKKLTRREKEALFMQNYMPRSAMKNRK